MTSKRVTVKSPILYKSVSGNVGLKIQGKTEQKTYTGKNLLDCSGLVETISNGVTFTPAYDENGNLEYINVNGTASKETRFYFAKATELPTGSYIFTGCPKNGAGGTYVIGAYCYVDDVQKWNLEIGNGITFVASNSLVIEERHTGMSPCIIISANYTCDNLKFYPMLRISTEDETYEPYVGGKPSPSPSYPQEIKSVVLNTIKTRTKNLFHFPNVYYNGTGLTLAKNTDGTYSLNGNVTGNEIRFLGSYANTDKVITLKNGNYKCVATINDKVINSDVTLTNGTTVKGYSGNNFAITDEWAISSLKVTVPSDVSSYSNAILKIMICDYNASDNFEPYQSTEITLSKPIELNGFNGVYDVLTSDGVTRRFAEYTITGDENIYLHAGGKIYVPIDSLYNKIKSGGIVSSTIAIINTNSTHSSGYYCNLGMAGVYFTRNDVFDTAEDFINYVKSNPVKCLIELATPTTEELPTELKNIKSFDGTTHIEIDCEIDTTIYADYLREVNIVGKICLGDNEVPALAFGDKKAILACLGDKEVWIDIAPECVAFSADVTLSDGYSYINGFSESNRFVDDTLLSEVAAPINNVVWCKTDTTQSNTVTKKAYVPSAKALKKYKYAVVTIKSSIAYHNGTNTGIFGNITLPKLPADNTIVYNTNTYKVELNDNTNIQSICNAIKGQTNWATASNIAIEKIILTNAEE